VYRATAHIYDLIYEAQGKDYAAEASVIDETIQARFPGATSLLDVACGTGGHLAHLRERYDVVGVDLDRGMLEVARRRLPHVELVEGDMRTIALDRTFDAVTCLFSAVGHLPTVNDLRTAFTTMARHLNPGGVLVVDGWVRPDQWRDPGTTSLDVAENDEVKVVRLTQSRRDGANTDLEMHHLIATATGIQHVVEHHELTLFTPDDYVGATIGAGLAAEVVESPMSGRDRYLGVRPRT
jgi:SAM-dependent methyltransferase